MSSPELTPEERKLLSDPLHYRGYTPDDDVPEPTEAPSEPAGPAAPGADRQPD